MAINVTTHDRRVCDFDTCTRAGTVTIDGITGVTIAACRRHARQLADRLTAALADEKAGK